MFSNLNVRLSGYGAQGRGVPPQSTKQESHGSILPMSQEAPSKASDGRGSAPDIGGGTAPTVPMPDMTRSMWAQPEEDVVIAMAIVEETRHQEVRKW